MRNRELLYAAAGMVLIAGGLCSLRAGSFSVNPVRVDLSARERHTTLRITNAGTDKVTVQVHPMHWIVQEKKESLQSTDDLIVNPPIFSIAAHQTQYIRIGLRHFEQMEAEQTYRLVLEEIPPRPTQRFNGLRTILRISIPIFVESPIAAGAALSWEIKKSPGEGITLSVQNHGTTHTQLKQISIGSPAANQAINHSLPAYLLPGEQREWHFDDANLSKTERVSLEAITDSGSVSETLAVQNP